MIGQIAMKRRDAQLAPDERADSRDPLDAVLKECLKQLSCGNQSAREKILEVCQARLHDLAHKLLGKKFSKVRRWDDTDDVAQNAAIRLYRALAETVPDSPRGLMGLMATQIRRELLDLARKHSGPMSYAANHGTNVIAGASGPMHVVDQAMDPGDQDEVPIERWEQFHLAIEKLPADQREVFSLIWCLGLEQQAAADTLGVSLRTVSRRWQEARQAIRASLGELDELP
jgi:RNA polymerase sigma factor (sigma-70 family)